MRERDVMRTLNRNKRRIYYALYAKDEPNYDEYGNETGEPTPVYEPAIELKCNVSAAVGADVAEAFGNLTSYSRTICVSSANCPIDEKTIVWFDRDPSEPHNYIVVRKADSKNGILYALREVTVT
jgi:hypothetical protein